MSRRDLQAIGDVSQLVLDHRLAALREAASQLERSRAQLAAINAAAAPADLPPVAARLVDVSYQRWADTRRTDLNTVMAQQTVALIDARGEASTAFGRLQALRGLAERLGRRR